MSTQKASVKKAFTLTELLVSMAILGLIATLTLPHMFMSVDRAKKRAVFKEAYQAIAEAVHTTFLEGGNESDVIKKLNPFKVCDTNAFEQGCTENTYSPHSSRVGIVLATGVSVSGFNFNYDQTGVIANRHGVYIGLEDFPKKEYFRVVINLMETPYDTVNSAADWWAPYQVRVDAVVRPGEIKCVEQACLDMFKD